jgi:hypothetical protein
VTFQVRKAKVDGVDSIAWCHELFRALCEHLSPWHGIAQMLDEFYAKNISHEGGGTRAVGRDISRYLPGLYWLNFFGRPYRDFIGRERLLTAPAHEVKELDSGVLLSIHKDAKAWNTLAYQAKEEQILQHIGHEYFFSKSDPNRTTTAPDFGRNQKQQEISR